MSTYDLRAKMLVRKMGERHVLHPANQIKRLPIKSPLDFRTLINAIRHKEAVQ